MSDWEIFTGQVVEEPTNRAIDRLPPPPPWRKFATLDETRGRTYQASPREVEGRQRGPVPATSPAGHRQAG